MLPPMRVVLALALLGVGDAASPEVDPALWQEYYQQGTTHNLPSEAGYVSTPRRRAPLRIHPTSSAACRAHQ